MGKRIWNWKKWTYKEMKYLEDNCKILSKEQIAQKLNRTVNSVAIRLSRNNQIEKEFLYRKSPS